MSVGKEGVLVCGLLCVVCECGQRGCIGVGVALCSVCVDKESVLVCRCRELYIYYRP